MTELLIRQAAPGELGQVLAVTNQAFGSDEEAELVRNLAADPSAEPQLSLLARQGGRAIGHILFTSVRLITDAEDTAVSAASILAPLSVIPEFQKQGIGTALIAVGCQMLHEQGNSLVFVLGYPDYYNRHSFVPAIPLGFMPPYPIEEKNQDAWMVRFLRPAAALPRSTLRCADVLDDPRYWCE